MAGLVTNRLPVPAGPSRGQYRERPPPDGAVVRMTATSTVTHRMQNCRRVLTLPSPQCRLSVVDLAAYKQHIAAPTRYLCSSRRRQEKVWQNIHALMCFRSRGASQQIAARG